MPKQKDSHVSKTVENTITKVAGEALEGVEYVYDSAGRQFERTVQPIRQNVFKRFPILFLIAVTGGVVAVSSGIEQILVQYGVLQEHPWLITGSGIIMLALTGMLYKKLG